MIDHLQYAVDTTKKYSVLNLVSVRVVHKSLLEYVIEAGNEIDLYASKLNIYGCVICEGIVGSITEKDVNISLNPLIKHLIHHYDVTDDSFSDIDQEHLNITRMPRIGNGKHNIHFDPQFSVQHSQLQKLTERANLDKILSNYMGKECSLRETGISITRPTMKLGAESLQVAGEGMEWHSDGSKGEATVLMSIQDIDPSMGCLQVVPRSHLDYVDGIGHEEEQLASKIFIINEKKVDYAYRAFQPIIIDARTLHSVSNNISDNWRVVVWFIFDSY